MEDLLLQNQEKSSWTNRCLLALLSLVAIAGVGIGVFSVVHSSSLQGDIDELRSQLKALQNNTPASNATVGKLVAEVQAVEAGITSINQFLGDDSVVTTLQCLDDTTKLVYASNGMAVASCPANCDASVSASHLWGTHIYSASSSICLAAVHDGELQLSAGGIIRVVQQPGEDHYTGSTQHGVTSSDKDASKSSFSIGTTLRQLVSDNNQSINQLDATVLRSTGNQVITGSLEVDSMKVSGTGMKTQKLYRCLLEDNTHMMTEDPNCEGAGNKQEQTYPFWSF